MEIEQIVGWTPIQIYLQKPHPVLEWCDLRDVTFSEPFFEEMVAHCLHNDPNRIRVQTKLEALAELHEINPGLEPTGFIFHMSKCGSTLISRILSALPQNLVISEAVSISSILLGAKLLNLPEEQVIKWLRLLFSALGQRRLGLERNYFIKFSSWNVLKLPLIKKAYPDVPWIFVYRDPIEVMVSVLKSSRGWIKLKTKPQIAEMMTGLGAKEIEQMSAEEYCARGLANFCQTALQMSNQNSLLLNYKQLPEAGWSSLPDFFQVTFLPDEKERMRDLSQFYSKDPTSKKLFTNDSAAKQKESSETVWKMANKYLVELYENLELIRLTQNIGA